MFKVMTVVRKSKAPCALITVKASNEEAIFICCGLTCAGDQIIISDTPEKIITPTAIFRKVGGEWSKKEKRVDSTKYSLTPEARAEVQELFDAAIAQGKADSADVIGKFLGSY